MELRAVAGSAERTLLHGFATIDGSVRGGTDVKGVVHVIVELVGVSGILLTSRQDLASLQKATTLTRGAAKKQSKRGLPQQIFLPMHLTDIPAGPPQASDPAPAADGQK